MHHEIIRICPSIDYYDDKIICLGLQSHKHNKPFICENAQFFLRKHSMERVVLDKEIRYIDGNGNLLRSRTEFSFSKILNFMGQKYEYNTKVNFEDKTFVTIDFKSGDRYIEVIDSEADADKLKLIRRKLPEINIIGVGHSKYAGKVNELESFFFFNSDEEDQTASIFIEDQSLAFDYAHILPLVEKCSILHGHASAVMFEIIGNTKNNLV